MACAQDALAPELRGNAVSGCEVEETLVHMSLCAIVCERPFGHVCENDQFTSCLKQLSLIVPKRLGSCPVPNLKIHRSQSQMRRSTTKLRGISIVSCFSALRAHTNCSPSPLPLPDEDCNSLTYIIVPLYFIIPYQCVSNPQPTKEPSLS